MNKAVNLEFDPQITEAISWEKYSLYSLEIMSLNHTLDATSICGWEPWE